MHCRYTLYKSAYINLFISLSLTIFLLFILDLRQYDVNRSLLIISTFFGSWFVIQQTIICFLTEYMVGCAWYGLRGLSRFALDSLTLNFSYIEISTEADMKYYLCNYILT
jgi:hypothetical protein